MVIMKKISVIVPVYNVEAYIEKGIVSLINQTYQNLEIIIIDDGSTDSSSEICDAYGAKDNRIQVLHVKNGGQSKARNLGLSIATGEYIGFMDGDDYVESVRYEKAVALLEEYQADIVECNFEGRKLKVHNDCGKEGLVVCSGKDALRRQLDDTVFYSFPTTSVWPKLFKREIIEDLFFPEGKVHEEYAFLCKAMYRSSKYVYSNEILYHRVLREDSTTASKFSERYFDKLDVIRERSDFLLQMNEMDLYQRSKFVEYKLMLELFYESKLNKIDYKASEMKVELNKKKVTTLKGMRTNKKRIEYILFLLSPQAYYLFRKKKNT